MIKIFILSALFPGGFAMMPFDTPAACDAAMAALIVTASQAECTEIEGLAADSAYAPEMAPLPPPKPGAKA